MENTYSNELYLKYMIANCAAPVLAKRKPAGLMTVWKHYLKNFDFSEYCKSPAKDFLNGGRLEILLETKLYYLLFCYQEEQLAEKLEKDKNSVILVEYSDLSNTQEKIHLLKKNMQKYYMHGTDFPHEVGLFLGYPVWDVQGFIVHGGKDYKICGYWKVYEDVPGALCKFKEYEWIKKCVLERFYRDLTKNNQKI